MRKLNSRKNGARDRDIFKSDVFFDQKILKYFNDFFTVKVNPTDSNNIKPDILPWNILN